jgi:hypothetical protein
MIAADTGYSPTIRGHRAITGGRNFCRYTVYNNKTDFPVIVDGTAEECSKALNRSRNSFYCLVDRVRKGKNRKFTILQRMVDEEDEEDAE